jgi:hypothetical protein
MKANKENLYQHVEFLTSMRPYRNFLNLESLQRCVDYFHEQFASYGLTYRNQKWVTSREVQEEYTNVIASYRPEKERRLIVGAHYDVCGDQPGADDNASAVAGLLESARIVAEAQPDLDYGIDFVAYCLEEPPFFSTSDMGSYVHAQSLYEDKVDVIGMICYEMIGYFSDEPDSQPYPHPLLKPFFPDKANFIMVVGRMENEDFNHKVYNLMYPDSGIPIEVISFPSWAGLADMSDHRNYWAFGYPACMINDTSFVRNPHYHQATDDIGTLDFDKMTEVVTSTCKAIVGMDKKVSSQGPLKSRLLKQAFKLATNFIR